MKNGFWRGNQNEKFHESRILSHRIDLRVELCVGLVGGENIILEFGLKSIKNGFKVAYGQNLRNS